MYPLEYRYPWLGIVGNYVNNQLSNLFFLMKMHKFTTLWLSNVDICWFIFYDSKFDNVRFKQDI